MYQQSKTRGCFGSCLARAGGRLLAAFAVVQFLGNTAFAQSCALCYTSVAGGGPGVARALRGGILVLLVPPVMLFTALILVVVRWRTIHSGQ
jgi:hypothetical protein